MDIQTLETARSVKTVKTFDIRIEKKKTNYSITNENTFVSLVWCTRVNNLERYGESSHEVNVIIIITPSILIIVIVV